jgi:glycosyltransferase involved in cell wall biosynthesis
MALAPMDSARPTVSVIVPARNEEACLGACLQSLLAQTGISFEVIVVDDHSTDSTREIASSFPGVRVIEADPLRAGWTGKNNAVATGARQAHGDWLLFTDADTVHRPGSLNRAVAEAREHGADLLSYSPEQIAASFWEIATMPVIFAELARHYPPSKVSDPHTGLAAANGQFILLRRDAYDAIGGHSAIARDLLEDVALARAIKRSGRKILFRYAPDAVRTRMYRNFLQLRDGWTKNLALLFPKARGLAASVAVLWALSWVLLIAGFWGLVHGTWAAGICLLPMVVLYLRMTKAHFRIPATLAATALGPPLFSYLLLRSVRAHARGAVRWKDRTYPDASPQSVAQLPSRDEEAKVVLRTGS